MFIDFYRKELLEQLNVDCLKSIRCLIISHMGVPVMCSAKQFIFVFTHTRPISQTFNFVLYKPLKQFNLNCSGGIHSRG